MGPNLLGCCCALMVVAALAVPARAEENSSEKPLSNANLFADVAADRQLEAALDQPLKTPMEFVNAPLNQITDLLVEEYGVSIRFDPVSMDFAKNTPEVKVTFKADKGTLRTALRRILESVELASYADEGVLLITADEIRCGAAPRVYAVGPLVTAIEAADPFRRRVPGPNGQGEKAVIDELIDAIRTTIAPESWIAAGTGEGEIKKLGRSYLVILQSEEVHEQIRRLLQELQYEVSQTERTPRPAAPNNASDDPFGN